MPRPVSSHSTYLPGLDGLRAVAVVAVILYHVDVSWMSGGLLGVGMFFTLSGYLITMILLRTWDRHGGLQLKTFYLRRARRLLPAVVLILLVVLAATVLVAPADLPSRLGESLAAMLYVFNWSMIASNTSYFDAFAGPGPLDHLWSLSVEEQFYLLWPLLLLGLLRLFKGERRRVTWAILALAAASFVLMAVVAVPGFDNTRAYEGTDTRAGGLLIGAALAMLWRPEELSAKVSQAYRNALDVAGVVALAVIVWLFATTDPYSLSLYSTGILLLSVATAVLVAVVVHPASRLAQVLGLAPLVWIGERSYGIYLWHLPIIVFTPATFLSDAPVLLASLQVLATLALSALSWTILEDPVRRHGFRRVLHPHRRTTTPDPGRLPAIVRGTGVLVALGIVALAIPPVLAGTAGESTVPDQVAGLGPDAPPPGPTDAPTPDPSASNGPASNGPASNGEATTTPDPGATPSPSQSGSPTPSATSSGPLATSCDAVVHLGDSTSRGLFSSNWLPDPDDRIDAQYQSVGVSEVHNEVSGAMSIVETYQDEPNADDRVASYMADGYDGCWVVALGLQDAANQAVGGVVSLDERIDLLMEQVDDAPALFMTGYAIETEGPWSDPELQKWNEAVVAACDRWPSMRVYDFRAEARDEWFDADDIHFNSEGAAARASRIADALAVAFPAEGDPVEECVVTTEG